MKVSDVKRGDTLVCTDETGTGYYRVLKVNRVTVDVRCENGNVSRMRPHLFDRKVTYEVPSLKEKP